MQLFLRSNLYGSTYDQVSRSIALPGGVITVLANGGPFSLSEQQGAGDDVFTRNGSGTTSPQALYFGRFISLPLQHQIIPAGTWTFGALLAEGNAQANSFTALSIYVCSPTGTNVRFIYDDSTPLGNEWSAVGGGRGRIASVSGGLVEALDNDVLVVELWRVATQGANGVYAQSITLDSPTAPIDEGDATGAAYLTTPADISFWADVSTTEPTTSGRDNGKRHVRERWFHCAIDGRLVPESDTVIPSPPHPQAGLRVCSRDLDEFNWLTNKSITPPPIEPDESQYGGNY